MVIFMSVQGWEQLRDEKVRELKLDVQAELELDVF